MRMSMIMRAGRPVSRRVRTSTARPGVSTWWPRTERTFSNDESTPASSSTTRILPIGFFLDRNPHGQGRSRAVSGLEFEPATVSLHDARRDAHTETCAVLLRTEKRLEDTAAHL